MSVSFARPPYLLQEAVCPLQCNGHGKCLSGFCKCEPGWYGTDCSRLAAGFDEDGVGHGKGAALGDGAVGRRLMGGSLASENASHLTGGGPWEVFSADGGRGRAVQSRGRRTGRSGGGGGEGGDGGSGGASRYGAGRVSPPRRKRPLIFIYDLPPDYNSRLLQYKNNPYVCSWRTFEVSHS